MEINQIFNLLRKSGKGLGQEEIQSALHLKRSEHARLRDMLTGLRKDGLLRLAGGRYTIASSRGLVRGRFVTGRRGFGFVIPPDGGQDVFIPARYAEGVMHGDEVEVAVREEGKFGKPEGRVTRVLHQANASLIGLFVMRGGVPFIQAFDTPTSEPIPLKAYPPREVKEGMLIEAGRKTMTVDRVYGFPGDPGVDIEVVIRRYGLRRDFPPEVMAETAAFPNSAPRQAIAGRTDYRGWKTFTIDGEKARDFDDAVSIRRLAGGRVLLGVHIADVSHYVRENTALDGEAKARATSVYFPDINLPMLPEKLSNGLCSLNPGVNRLAFSVLMEIDPRGRVVKSDFMPSVIKTAARLTYTIVSDIFRGDAKERARYKALVPDLELMKATAEALRGQRLREGSLDFDLVSPELVYEEGRLQSVVAAERNDANRLIEEFMVAANVAVAAFLNRGPGQSLNRIHPAPLPVDLEKLRLLLARFGYYLPEERPITPFDLQSVLRKAKGRPEEKFITVQVLRSMRIASYDTANIGHFGLAKTDYTHFTSPIRRYPDLVVHRLLRAALEGRRGPEDELPALAVHCSERERNADSAEQSLLQWRIYDLLRKRLGDVCEGVVVDMNKTGLIVELDDYFVEGLLPFETLGGQPSVGRKKGRSRPAKKKAGKRYGLGDIVKVTLASVDPVFQRMTFTPSEEE